MMSAGRSPISSPARLDLGPGQDVDQASRRPRHLRSDHPQFAFLLSPGEELVDRLQVGADRVLAQLAAPTSPFQQFDRVPVERAAVNLAKAGERLPIAEERKASTSSWREVEGVVRRPS